MLLQRFILLIMLFSGCFVSVGYAANTEESILLDKYKQQCLQLYESFYSETFMQRLALDFSKGYLTSNSAQIFENKLQQHRRSSSKLASNLDRLYKRIETYPGKDWESRFGSTGLWDDSKNATQQVQWLNANINLNLVSTIKDSSLKKQNALALLEELQPFFLQIDPHEANLFKAQLLLIAAQKDRSFQRRALNMLENIADAQNTSHKSYFTASSILLDYEYSSGQMKKLWDQLRNSPFDDDPELVLRFALIAYKNGSTDFLESCFLNWPPTIQVTSEIFIDCCIDQQGRVNSPCRNDSFTADVIAFGLNLAQSEDGEVDKTSSAKIQTVKPQLILSKLIEQPGLESRMLLYSCAITLWDVAPAKTVELLLRAADSRMLRLWYPEKLQRNALVELACRYSCDLLVDSNAYNEIAFSALNHYRQLEDSAKDDELEYLLASELLNNNKTDARAVLSIIANEKTNQYSAKAKLDLLMYDYINSDLTEKQLNKLVSDTKSILTNFSRNSDEYTDSLMLYVTASMDIGEEKLLRNAYSSLIGVDSESEPEILCLKAQLACMVGQYDDAVLLLSDCASKNKQLDQQTAIYILDRVLAKYEQIVDSYSQKSLQREKEFKDCLFAIATQIKTDADPRKASLKNEAIILAGYDVADDYGKAQLTSADYIEILRVFARQDMSCGNYNIAAGHWGKIALRLGKMSEEYQWQWARAKYYQLYCYSKNTDFDKNELKRAINVILNGSTTIDEYWKEKISSLLG